MSPAFISLMATLQYNQFSLNFTEVLPNEKGFSTLLTSSIDHSAFFVMERASMAYWHLFQVTKNKHYYF